LQPRLSRLLLLGVAMECGLLAMLEARPGPGRMGPFLVLFFAVFGLYLLAVRIALGSESRFSDRPGLLVVALACLFRLTFLLAPPLLSHDLYRYLWDGRILLAGGNPYLEPPASRAAGEGSDADRSTIEHAEVPTIYPPLAQLLFLAGAALGAGVYGIKVMILVADLLVILVLRALLRSRGHPPVRVLIYAWNPLALTETAWSGHIDAVAILCVLLAAGAIIQKRDGRATLALATGGLVKLLPLAYCVPCLRSIRVRSLLVAPALVAAAYWPFRAAGWRLFAGLREYADRWLGNESLFAVVRLAIEWSGPTERLKAAIAWVRRSVPHTGWLDPLYAYVYPLDLAKGVCGLLLLAFAVELWRRRVEPLRGCFLMTCAVLLLSPTAHPWYFLWVLPWLCLFPSRSWILLTGLAPLAYVNLGASGRESEPYPFIRLMEYTPFFVLLCLDWLRAKSRRAADPAPGVDPPQSR
jgi:alpha-1,6-mannosyltransferase